MGEKMENNVKDIKYYLKKSFPFIIAIFMSAIIVAASQVSIALSMKYALEMLLSEEYNEIIYLLIIFLAIILISGLGYYLLGVSGAKFKKSFLFSLKKDCTDQILKMSLRDFSQHSIGEISSTITNDVNKFDTQYLDTIIKIILQTTTFIFSSAVLFYYNPLLALSIYIFAAIMVFLPRKSYQQMGLLGKMYSESMGEYSKKVQELLTGFLAIKTSNINQMVSEEVDSLNDKNETARYNIGIKEAKISSMLAIFSLMTFYIPFLIGVIFVFTGAVEIGVLIAVINLSGSVINPVQQIGGNIASLKAGQGIFDNISKIINSIDEEQKSYKEEEKVQIDTFNSKLAMDKVTFSYGERIILSDFSLEILKGEKALILGSSGSGKSTILKLLAGLYDDYTGSIYIDDKEIRGISSESLFKLISFVPQDTFIFNKSVRENITLSTQTDLTRLERVIKDALLDEFINKLSEGMETILGDGGTNLSGGEKQRIAIARALYRDTPILLVDEPTASLDEVNSKMIFDILLNSSKTIVCVTHKIDKEQMQKFDIVVNIEKDSTD